MSVFETLNGLNVNDHTETKKSGNTELTYLSWPWAWAEVKKRYPGAHYTIWKDANGKPYAFDTLTGFMVYTTVTIGEETHDMWLPVMDGANNAMKAEPYDYKVKNPNFKWAKWDEKRGKYFDKYGNEQTEYTVKHVNAATMFDINKTLMRCLVKNLAMFGLGLYIYAGEDLPESENDDKSAEEPIPRTGSTEAAQEAGEKKLEELNARIAKATEKPSVAVQRRIKEEPAQEQKTASTGISGAVATPEQIEYIKDHASDDDYMDIMTRYGANLENLSQADAEREIAEIDKHNEPMIPTCERCGKAITGVALPDGSRMTASELIGKSKLTYNGVYCFGCMKELNRKKKAG